MKNLIILLLLISLINETMTIDFGQEKVSSWYTVNDTVMGGRSSGKARYTANSLLFTGSVSFENNGGFASVRSEEKAMDLSAFETATVRYRSEGQSLSLNFNYYRQWWYPNYKAELPATKGDWKTITFPLKDLKEYRVGRPTGDQISSNQLHRVIRLGIMTADKKEGTFQAEIDYVRFE